MFVNRPPRLAEEDVETSEGMAADVTPSAHAADAADVEKNRRHRKKNQKQLALSGELGVLSSDSDEAVLVRVTQVFSRMDVPESVRVTQFVCEVEKNLIVFGI